MTTNVLMQFKDATLIDDSKFSKLPFDEKDKLFNGIISNPAVKPVFVQSFASMKSTTALRNAAMSGEDVYYRAAVIIGRDLTTAELDVLNNLRTSIQQFTEILGTSMYKYPYAEVPEDVDINSGFGFMWNQKSVRRASSSYSISFTQLEKIWKKAAKLWMTGELNAASSAKDTELVITDTNRHTRDVRIDMSQVRIGCQTVQRWELEQAAVRLQFEFP